MVRCDARHEVVTADDDEVGDLEKQPRRGRDALDVGARTKRSEQTLPAERDKGRTCLGVDARAERCRAGPRKHRPRVSKLAGDRTEHQRVPSGGPRAREVVQLDRCGRGHATLAPARGLLDVFEDRAGGERDPGHAGTSVLQQLQLARASGSAIDADERPHVDPLSRERERDIGHRATEAPAARILARQVTGGGTDDQRNGAISRHAVF